MAAPWSRDRSTILVCVSSLVHAKDGCITIVYSIPPNLDSRVTYWWVFRALFCEPVLDIPRGAPLNRTIIHYWARLDH
ncbi:PREDICTED: uncharacterized protein LOC108551303 [Eufriesea mexicana]|uniref:uncharacterized protein LOC108551303 n=1 Tax=Eufriesea mexicana TaxID=516756 RepID=UPI00083BBF21|nr:PREDICTED: uncharacterized protein LOC108551303 [Eufriesea mexicana]